MRTDAERLQQEAADWVVRMHSDQRTQADHDAFSAWIATSEAHADAYADLATVWESFGLLRENATAAAVLRAQPAPARRLASRGRWAWAAAGLAACAAGALLLVLLPRERAYETAPGATREVALNDGSSLVLDTDTKIRVAYSQAERRLILDRGQAYVQVAKNAHRPFLVMVGSDEVRAVGTAFEVRRVGDSARVVLVEGRLDIYRNGRGAAPGAATENGAPVKLSAGQELDLDPGDASPPKPANLARALAWRSNRLVFDDAPLSEVVTELNRYGGPRVRLADAEAGRLRVSGVFHTGGTQDTVAALAAAFPITVERRDSDEIVLGSRPGAGS